MTARQATKARVSRRDALRGCAAGAGALATSGLLGSSAQGAALRASNSDLDVLAPADEPRRMLYAYLLAECNRHFEERRKVIEALKTPVDVQARARTLREKFIAALGGLPERTPLNARVTGRQARAGYHIEKVIFESRPRHHVTATLYLPDGKGPFPTVLFPCGHTDNAKAAPDYQHACMLIAKYGMAAFSFDPISQGERVQILTEAGKPAVGYGNNEHTLADVGALLTGSCTAAYHIWDGMRALDYLETRPEVDRKRLGCMGNSGGGTQTAYLMALDERILCAVPNCYITSLERLYATVGPQDGEQNIPGRVAFGLEHADYLLMRAPRPTQINCNTHDYFDVQGAWDTFRESKRVYALLGHSERVDLFEHDAPHGLVKEVREGGVTWLRRWLTGVDEVAVEGDVPAAKDADLQCTASGQVLRELRGKSVFDINAERAAALAAKRKRLGQLGKEALLANVRRAIGLANSIAPAQPSAKRPVPGAHAAKSFWQTEPGIKVPCLTFSPKAGPAKSVVIHVDGEGKANSLTPGGAVQALVASGHTVLSLDLRGMGETLPNPKHTGLEPFVGYDWKEAFLGMDLDRPLLGQRVYDILSIVSSVLAALKTPVGVHLYGVGAAVPVVLHAAALDPRITETTIDGGVISWSEVAATAITTNQLTNVVPGALATYDLPDLLEAIAPRPLAIRNPVDAVGKPIAQAVVDRVYAPARAAYAATGASANLTLRAGV